MTSWPPVTSTRPPSTTTVYSMFTQRGRGTLYKIPENQNTLILSDEKAVKSQKYENSQNPTIIPPPIPPKPPSIKSLRLLQKERKQRIRQVKRKKKKKRRIQKKELKKQAAIKRSLTFQYKVLDFINRTAFWTTFLSVIGFAFAMQ